MMKLYLRHRMLYNFEWTDLLCKKPQFFNKFLRKSAEFYANLTKKNARMSKMTFNPFRKVRLPQHLISQDLDSLDGNAGDDPYSISHTSVEKY